MTLAFGLDEPARDIDHVLKHRLATGILLIGGLILIVWLDDLFASQDGPLPTGSILALFCVVAVVPLLSLELCTLLEAVGVRLSRPLVVIGGILLTLAMWRSTTGALFIPASLLVFVMIAAFAVGMRDRSPEGVLLFVSTSLFAVAYSGGLIGFWLMLRTQHSPWVVFGAILTVKMSDIGAYAVGSSIGRTKLIPWLSPKKTWEGLAGGIIAAGVCGGLLALASQVLPEHDQYPILSGVIFGVLAAILGLFGDLIGSAMKRNADVKDSGSILPGLGGAIDTLDSLLLVGPLAWWLLG